MCFFFKQKTAYEMRISDWSSDVCSSDLLRGGARGVGGLAIAPAGHGGGGDGQQRGTEDGALVHAWAPCSTGAAASRPLIAPATSPGCSIPALWPLPTLSTIRARVIRSAYRSSALGAITRSSGIGRAREGGREGE